MGRQCDGPPLLETVSQERLQFDARSGGAGEGDGVVGRAGVDDEPLGAEGEAGQRGGEMPGRVLRDHHGRERGDAARHVDGPS